jgi:hypothetical protein
MCGFDGYFETMFNDAGFNVYVMPTRSRYAWNVDLPKKGKNTFILPQTNDVPVDLEIDAVLCCDRLYQYELTSQLSTLMHTPHICVEHFMSTGRVTEQEKELIQKNQKFDAHISISNEIASEWKNTTVIPYATDRITHEHKENLVLLAGDFQQADLQLIHQLAQHIPNLVVVGENPGISRRAPNETELEKLYDRAGIYINIGTEGRIPPYLIKAMGAHCAIVSNMSPVLDGVLNRENAILCSSFGQFIEGVNRLTASSAMRDKFGDAAQSTIINSFNMSSFKTSWQNILNSVGKRTYVR